MGNSLIKKIYIAFMESKIGEIFRFCPYLSDKTYITYIYKKMFGVEPNLEKPTNFNEKNNWRKLYDRKPLYTQMVDKYRIKQLIEERLGNEYSFPLLGVWNRPKDIDYASLPDKFVLKVNHAGGVIVCRDKNSFDKKSARKELEKAQRRNYYIRSREWPYKNVERKIIAEMYMGENLTDYKNYCFNGKLLYTCVWNNQSREDGHKPQAYFCGAYDRNWCKSDLEIDYPTKDVTVERPEVYDEMVRVAETMSKDIPFVRVDCYIINNRVYIGEMTFFPWGGFLKFKDEQWNNKLGFLQVLPNETMSDK